MYFLVSIANFNYDTQFYEIKHFLVRFKRKSFITPKSAFIPSAAPLDYQANDRAFNCIYYAL